MLLFYSSIDLYKRQGNEIIRRLRECEKLEFLLFQSLITFSSELVRLNYQHRINFNLFDLLTTHCPLGRHLQSHFWIQIPYPKIKSTIDQYYVVNILAVKNIN